MQVCSGLSEEYGPGRSTTHYIQSSLQGVSVDAEHIACLVGCGAILDVLFHSITAAGDGVLIPAPFYPAFPNDLEVRHSELLKSSRGLDPNCCGAGRLVAGARPIKRGG